MKQNDEIVSNLAIITHLTGASNYTWVHFKDKPRLLVSKSLTYFEDLLPSCVRIHKTALVNPAYIEQIKPPLRAKTPGSVTMLGGDSLPISRRRWQEVAELLQASEPFGEPVTKLKNRSVAALEGQAETVTDWPNRVVDSSERFVYAFMQDERKCRMLEEIVDENWPHYTIRFFDNSSSLTSQLTQVGTNDLPTLVFLEVRNVGWPLLSTLEFMKNDNRFRHIPALVFIRDQSGNDVEVCYAAGANSVVCQSGSTVFAEAAEQICAYWLTFAALPVN
ncbi:response regulator transcription factor [Spirosoma agri]|uniref:LytTR family transcriptional regulator n=1 Tax=Spirosoma agri TaxID=1987381 RepID=A0A6M0IDK1_9BACT|nr:LytTR family transcriptional regulator DNA-binding domain-containing protein [Spirosoma agri]NEU66360.1 LytTR family transcriptional regulator [Spirosoma agri]